MKHCEWCSSEFEPAVKFQIYCSSNCRDQATKQKVYDRYHQNKVKKRRKEKRLCAGGCGIMISVYNDEKFCSQCNVNVAKVDKMLERIKNLSGIKNEKHN